MMELFSKLFKTSDPFSRVGNNNDSKPDTDVHKEYESVIFGINQTSEQEHHENSRSVIVGEDTIVLPESLFESNVEGGEISLGEFTVSIFRDGLSEDDINSLWSKLPKNYVGVYIRSETYKKHELDFELLFSVINEDDGCLQMLDYDPLSGFYMKDYMRFAYKGSGNKYLHRPDYRYDDYFLETIDLCKIYKRIPDENGEIFTKSERNKVPKGSEYLTENGVLLRDGGNGVVRAWDCRRGWYKIDDGYNLLRSSIRIKLEVV